MNKKISFIVLLIFMIASTWQAQAWDICQGDLWCSVSMIGLYYVPFYVILWILIFSSLVIFKKKLLLKKKLKFSILMPFLVLFVYHNFLSVWLEKQSIKNNITEKLSQVRYSLFVPSYIPQSYDLHESRVYWEKSDSLQFSLSYKGDWWIFTLSQFKKPSGTFLDSWNCKVMWSDFKFYSWSDFSSSFDFSCNKLESPNGIKIYEGEYSIASKQKYALFIIDGTLHIISRYDISQEELVQFVDWLKKQPVENIPQKNTW